MRFKQLQSLNKSTFILGFVIVYFAANFISRLLNYYDLNIRLTALTNGAFQLLFILLFLKTLIKSRQIMFPIILGTTFIIGQFFLVESKIDFSGSKDVLYEVTYGHILQLNNYIFPIVFSIGFCSLKSRYELASKVFKILETLFYFNSVFVLFGVLSDVEYFKAYPFSDRFGYMGLFNANTFTVYFYCLITVFLYYKYNNKTTKVWNLLYAIFIGLLLGKKAFLLLLGLLVIYHLWKNVRISKIKLVAIFATSLTIAIVLKDKLLQLVFNVFPFWENIYKKNGLFAFITSHRNIKLEYAYGQIIENWTLPNYIFGGMIFPTYRTEWGIIDLYITFGFIGLLVYTLWFQNLFNGISKKQTVLLVLILIIAFFVGGFFVNVNLMMFFIILTVLFSTNNTSKNSKNVVNKNYSK